MQSLSTVLHRALTIWSYITDAHLVSNMVVLLPAGVMLEVTEGSVPGVSQRLGAELGQGSTLNSE